MPKPKAQKTTPKTDREMILSPDDWPKWPLLPMKKHAPDYRCGVIVGDPKDNQVYFIPDAYIWRIEQDQLRKGSMVEIDDLLSQGWVVD